MKDNSLYIQQVGIFTDPEPDLHRSHSQSRHFVTIKYVLPLKITYFCKYI